MAEDMQYDKKDMWTGYGNITEDEEEEREEEEEEKEEEEKEPEVIDEIDTLMISKPEEEELIGVT
jgi:hypothetical protein